MGLSRKLGGVVPRVTEPVNLAVPYKWSTQTYTMAELLDKFKLPCVVQCATDSCTVVWSDFHFDLRQPMLLYDRRTVQKLHAMSLSVPKGRPGSGDSQALEEVGPPMAIPCDYEGWFGAAPKGQSKVKRHTRVEGVANSTTRRFLVTTKLPAFTSSRAVGGGGGGSGDDNCFVPHDVTPGEVLKRVCVLDPSPDDPDCPAVVREHGPCLECLDEKDEDVLIPLSRRAILYEVAETYPDDVDRVFTVAQVIAAGNTNLPRVLKLAHGDPPQLAYAFTGMLRGYTVFTEETILASTLDDAAPICLELATDSKAQFRLGLNEAAVKRTCEYGNALHMCETFGAKFLTGIKVSFSLQPEITDLEDIDLSFYESQNSCSDMQEVEANSEFEIAWGAVKKAKLLRSAPVDVDKTESEDSDDDNNDAHGNDKNVGDFEANDDFLEGSLLQTKGKPRTGFTSHGALSSGKDQAVPEHRDFTESDITDLMKRKGLLAGPKSEEDLRNISRELGLLNQEISRDNPLYHYFQKQSDERDLHIAPKTELKSSGIDGLLIDKKDKTVGNPSTLKQLLQQEQSPSTDNLPDVITNPLNDSKQKDASIESEVEELDSSAYEQAVCTPAREYSEVEIDESDSDEDSNNSDNDGDMFYNKEEVDSEVPDKNTSSTGKTATQIPIETKVVVMSMGKRATRSYPNIDMADSLAMKDFRCNIADTSSSDDVRSDFERRSVKALNSAMSNLQQKLSGNNGAGHPKQQSPRAAKISPKKFDVTLSSSDETGFSDASHDHRHNFKRGNESQTLPVSNPQSLVAAPPRPTFTEADDPLENTMSELDMVTSIVPESFTTKKYAGSLELDSQPFTKRPHSSSDRASGSKVKGSGLEVSPPWKSDELISPLTTEQSKVSGLRASNSKMDGKRNLRPSATLNASGNKTKRVDVTQEEGSFDSPKVSHQPHAHPHSISPSPQWPNGALHLGHWTKPVPLGGPCKDKDKDSTAIPKTLISSHGTTPTTTFVSEPSQASSSPARQRSFIDSSIKDGQNPMMISSTQHPKKSLRSKTTNNAVSEASASSTDDYMTNASLNVGEGYALNAFSIPGKSFTTQASSNATENYTTNAGEYYVEPDSSNPGCLMTRLWSHQSSEDLDRDSDDEEVTMVEEHFYVSTDSPKSGGSNLRVLPLYHEDLETSDYV